MESFGIIYLGGIFMDTKKKTTFRINTPKRITFWISAALGVLGVIGTVLGLVIPLPLAAAIGPWVTAAGWLLVTLGCFVKGL